MNQKWLKLKLIRYQGQHRSIVEVLECAAVVSCCGVELDGCKGAVQTIGGGGRGVQTIGGGEGGVQVVGGGGGGIQMVGAGGGGVQMVGGGGGGVQTIGDGVWMKDGAVARLAGIIQNGTEKLLPCSVDVELLPCSVDEELLP